MTRAQYRILNRLRKKQTNRDDVTVVDSASHFVVFHLAFPGIYVTYNDDGHLIETETEAQRKEKQKPLAIPGKVNLVIGGEMGSDNYGMQPNKPIIHDDDDVPF